MKYFITGATGFVGSWVTEKLIKQGAEVTCLVRKTSNLRWINHLPVKYHYGSLTDLDSLKKGVESVDYVLHIGGVTKTLIPFKWPYSTKATPIPIPITAIIEFRFPSADL